MTLSVYLYVPNLIGYTRVALGLYAFAHAFSDWQRCLFAYALSQLLDAADGYAARALKQSSQFGAVLDMVTDRVSSNILIMILGVLYGRDYFMGFAILAMLDYASHWFSMYASVYTGSGSHKTMNETRPWLLRIYYRSKVVLFMLCLAQEASLMALYVLKAGSSGSGLGGLLYSLAWNVFVVSAPFSLLKQIINVVQLIDASNQIIDKEASKPKRK